MDIFGAGYSGAGQFPLDRSVPQPSSEREGKASASSSTPPESLTAEAALTASPSSRHLLPQIRFQSEPFRADKQEGGSDLIWLKREEGSWVQVKGPREATHLYKPGAEELGSITFQRVFDVFGLGRAVADSQEIVLPRLVLCDDEDVSYKMMSDEKSRSVLVNPQALEKPEEQIECYDVQDPQSRYRVPEMFDAVTIDEICYVNVDKQACEVQEGEESGTFVLRPTGKIAVEQTDGTFRLEEPAHPFLAYAKQHASGTWIQVVSGTEEEEEEEELVIQSMEEDEAAESASEEAVEEAEKAYFVPISTADPVVTVSDSGGQEYIVSVDDVHPVVTFEARVLMGTKTPVAVDIDSEVAISEQTLKRYVSDGSSILEVVTDPSGKGAYRLRPSEDCSLAQDVSNEALYAVEESDLLIEVKDAEEVSFVRHGDFYYKTKNRKTEGDWALDPIPYVNSADDENTFTVAKDGPHLSNEEARGPYRWVMGDLGEGLIKAQGHPPLVPEEKLADLLDATFFIAVNDSGDKTLVPCERAVVGRNEKFEAVYRLGVPFDVEKAETEGRFSVVGHDIRGLLQTKLERAPLPPDLCLPEGSALSQISEARAEELRRVDAFCARIDHKGFIDAFGVMLLGRPEDCKLGSLEDANVLFQAASEGDALIPKHIDFGRMFPAHNDYREGDAKNKVHTMRLGLLALPQSVEKLTGADKNYALDMLRGIANEEKAQQAVARLKEGLQSYYPNEKFDDAHPRVQAFKETIEGIRAFLLSLGEPPRDFALQEVVFSVFPEYGAMWARMEQHPTRPLRASIAMQIGSDPVGRLETEYPPLEVEIDGEGTDQNSSPPVE